MTLQLLTLLDWFSTLVLIGLSLDHLITGFICFFMPNTSENMAKKIFGVTVSDKEFYKIIIKPWGALGLFACGVGLLPIIDPSKFISVSYLLLALLLLRIYYRLEEAKKAQAILGLSLLRNYSHVFLISLCILAIIEKIIHPLV